MSAGSTALVAVERTEMLLEMTRGVRRVVRRDSEMDWTMVEWMAGPSVVG
jgi:hypothetical protein